MSPQRKLLVVGAGYLGKRVAHFALQSGWRVTAARRKPPLDNDNSDLSWIDLDVINSNHVKDRIDQLSITGHPEAVVYCVSAGESVEQAYRNAYQIGVRNITDSLSPETRLIFVSSTGVYHQNSGESVDELSLTNSKLLSATQAFLLAGEAIVRDRPNSIVARLSGIYGPGRTRMIAFAQAIGEPYIVRERAYTNRIHVDDGARAILHLLELQNPDDTYCITDHEPATQNEILMWLRDAMAMPPITPQFLEHDRILSSELELPATNKKISNRRLLETGFKFQLPTYREGYSRLL